MARQFTDADFADTPQGRTFTDADFMDAVAQPSQSQLPDILTNEPSSGLIGSISRASPAIAGGMAGAAAAAPYGIPFGPAGVALAGAGGAVLGGASMEAARNAIAQGLAAMKGNRLSTPSEVIGNVSQSGLEQGVGHLTGEALAPGIKAVASKLLPHYAKTGSQVVRAATGVPEIEAEAALRDPSILSRAFPMKEAGKIYREGVGEAGEGTLDASRSIFGKTYPGPESVVNTFDELRGSLGAAEPNELLGMRQTMMDTLADTPRTSPKLRKLIGERIGILDDMLESRLPDWTGAKKAWREAKIGEEFGSWLPLNKNLSPNVLRTTAAIAAAAKSASEGSLWGSLALPFVSPKVWGLGIRATGAISGAAKPIYRVGVPAASSIADEYNRLGNR